MFKKTVITALTLLAFFGSSAAYGAEKPDIWLQISPVANRGVILRPSSASEYDFNVENIGKKDFKFKVSVAPYYAASSDYNMSFSTENKYTQISRWITFKGDDGNYNNEYKGIVKAGQKANIKYKITVPASVPAGGQYAVIFASPEPEENKPTGIRTISRAGLLVYGRAEGETKRSAKMELKDFKTFFSPSLFFKGDSEKIDEKTGKKIINDNKISASIKVKNDGNTDFTTSSTLTIKSLFGKVIHEEKVYHDVLPETERDIRVKWDKAPFFGIYQVTFNSKALEEKISFSKIVIIMPIIFIIIMLILLTAVIAWSIILIRKRSHNRSKVIN